jgi:hypothetical protein
MKSKGLPTAAHTQRKLAAVAAAALLCLAALRLAGADSSAAAGSPPSPQTGAAAASPQGSPVPAGSTVTTTTATTTIVTTPTPTPTPAGPRPTPTPVAGERVKLYYLRDGTRIATVLTAIAAAQGSVISGLGVGVIADDEIVLFGNEERRKLAKRLVATLDLPRPGVQMEMWGVQMSSREPEDLAEVMRRARAEIDKTQQAVRNTYAAMQEIARGIHGDQLDRQFVLILEDHLFYKSALESHRQLSLSDILLRLLAAKQPAAVSADLANRLDDWVAVNYPEYPRAMRAADAAACETEKKKVEKENKEAAKAGRPTREAQCRWRRPFERFFANRGLEYDGGQGGRWVAGGEAPSPNAVMQAARKQAVAENARIGKAALLNFALHYGRLIHDSENFDAYYLQQSAGTLNGRLQGAIDALNQDIRELFVDATLDKIRAIAAGFKDVEYAQVGRTTVSSLSGTPTVVSSKAVNTFESTRPLTLTDFLSNAKTLMEGTSGFVPNAAKTNMLGTIPFAEVVGLLGALGQDRSVWRELNSGVSFTITPSVLRNMSSAELNVLLETGDPVASGTQQNAPGVRPLTRVSQHNVTTKVYVNALDFFDLSTFGSQATLSGGRGYVPIIGPFWRGLFGDAPVIGELLSWKKPPKTVYSQSLVLTTSFITPTAMGVALLLPTDSPDERDKLAYKNCYRAVQGEMDGYERALFGTEEKPGEAAEARARAQKCVDDARDTALRRAAAAGLKAEAAGLKDEEEVLKQEATTLEEIEATRKKVEEARKKVEDARRARAAAPKPTP